MFLQTDLTTRRKFLERSLWGFGSAFVLPSLLQSCTDHTIPPGTPVIPPILTDVDDIDWNDNAKIIVTGALELIPEVGEILGPLVDLFWPSDKKDVWGEIKAQVEALIDQEINALVYQQVSDDLQGLNNNIIKYLNEISYGSTSSILNQWQITTDLFSDNLPHFQSKGYEVLLSPLFGQFANMYLALLRDGVAFGQSWGRTPDEHTNIDIPALQNAISDFTTYATNTYNNGQANVIAKTKKDDHACEPFKSVNTYTRQMTLTLLDFRDTWAYFDVTKYPNGVQVTLPREIYTDPFGTCDDSGNIVIPTPVPTQRPTNLTVWGYDRIDAVQLTYPASSGPNSVTQTKRMGDQSGGSNQNPHGGIFNLASDVPIIQARATYGSIVNSMQFLLNDGTTTSMMGGNAGWGSKDSGLIGYVYEALSSVWINGVSQAYGSADCVVFGFQYWNPPAETLNALRVIYVKSPKEHTVADLAKKISRISIPANLITDELKAARKAYWAYIQARAKALK